MVGVAGKSKGCGTCRKRKVKCDEAKPVCVRCKHSNSQCDGYDRFPVSIDRDQTGYRKRLPLEEVKPYAQPQRIFSPEAESVRLISWFREAYVRSPPSKYALQTQVHWMGLVGVRHPPHPALKAALLAASFVKWSRVERNQSLSSNARRHYQQSLELTQKALSRVEDALLDDILATTCIMTLYELSDPDCQSTDNWLRHIAGIGNLLCLRGPTQFITTESRAMFEHMRHIFMVRCLAIKVPCIFGSAEWLQLPWHGAPKSVEQQVFDQGLRLTSLWKDCDLRPIDKHWPSEVSGPLSTCVDIFEKLDPLIALISPNTSLINADEAADTASSILSVTTLGVQLGAAISAHKLLSTSDASVSGVYVAMFSTSPETVLRAQTLCKARIPLARRILYSVGAGTDMQAGALGTLRILWSLQLAYEQFTPCSPGAEQCSTILAQLSKNTGPFGALALPLGNDASSPVYRSS